MTLNWTVLFLALLVGLSHASAKLELDFRRASIEDLCGMLEKTEDGAVEAQIVQGVLLSGRLDLIEFFFKKPETGLRIPKLLDSITDEHYRDQVVLLMLKTDSRNFWPTEKKTGSFIWHYKMIEPFVPTFERHLPNAKPLLDILMTKDSRLKTASELEAAMTARSRTGAISGPGISAPGPLTALETSSHRDMEEAPEDTSTAQVKNVRLPSPWWIVAGTVILSTVAARFLSKRRG